MFNMSHRNKILPTMKSGSNSRINPKLILCCISLVLTLIKTMQHSCIHKHRQTMNSKILYKFFQNMQIYQKKVERKLLYIWYFHLISIMETKVPWYFVNNEVLTYYKFYTKDLFSSMFSEIRYFLELYKSEIIH